MYMIMCKLYVVYAHRQVYITLSTSCTMLQCGRFRSVACIVFSYLFIFFLLLYYYCCCCVLLDCQIAVVVVVFVKLIILIYYYRSVHSIVVRLTTGLDDVNGPFLRLHTMGAPPSPLSTV